MKSSDGDLNCWRRFDFVGFRSKKVGAVGALQDFEARNPPPVHIEMGALLRHRRHFFKDVCEFFFSSSLMAAELHP